MMMPTNTVSLPWFLLLPLMISPSLSPDTSVLLLFDSSAPRFRLQNCSCATLIRDCGKELLESACSFHPVVKDAASPAGLRAPWHLSVWVEGPGVVAELLGRSAVGHVCLSHCGALPSSGGTLVVLGLQTLTVRASDPDAAHPEQTVTLAPSAGVTAALRDSGGASSVSHVTVLDLTVLNGRSALKSYSVFGTSTATFHQHFPHLATLPVCCHAHPLLITFVY